MRALNEGAFLYIGNPVRSVVHGCLPSGLNITSVSSEESASSSRGVKEDALLSVAQTPKLSPVEALFDADQVCPPVCPTLGMRPCSFTLSLDEVLGLLPTRLLREPAVTLREVVKTPLRDVQMHALLRDLPDPHATQQAASPLSQQQYKRSPRCATARACQLMSPESFSKHSCRRSRSPVSRPRRAPSSSTHATKCAFSPTSESEYPSSELPSSAPPPEVPSPHRDPCKAATQPSQRQPYRLSQLIRGRRSPTLPQEQGRKRVPSSYGLPAPLPIPLGKLGEQLRGFTIPKLPQVLNVSRDPPDRAPTVLAERAPSPLSPPTLPEADRHPPIPPSPFSQGAVQRGHKDLWEAAKNHPRDSEPPRTPVLWGPRLPNLLWPLMNN
ncbi:serine/arginine repetitive matrix protein 1-like [Macrobrachium nipponense]|uniref:serine/arginine repetitive matrix protein 1-like n=1 Tax=Macrobrachium nipponense TaxID=159736 RepID=UPI0030C7F74C